MIKKVAVQMDPIESIRFETDSSFIFSLEAQKRGYELFYYQPKNLYMKNGEVIAKAQKIKLKYDPKDYFKLGEDITISLSDMDVVLMRQDPPFDMNYITYTHFLEKIHPKTFVVNNPSEVRNCPEKLFVCDFKEFVPPTIISANVDSIMEFAKEYKDVVIKPLYAFGGRDVFHLTKEKNKRAKIKFLLKKYNTPIIAQKFLPGVIKGDKRVIFINGEVVSMLNRVPASGTILSNIAAGGHAEKTTLSKREMDICSAVGPELKKRGLITAGIDLIDGYVTEINVTSPTGFHLLNRMHGIKLEENFWDAVEGIIG